MGVGVGRQLKVTAHCHATVQSHYPSRRLRRRSPPPRDGQMTIIPALLFAAVSSSAGTHLFLRFAPIYICESVKLHCWLKCQSFFLSFIKTFWQGKRGLAGAICLPSIPNLSCFLQKSLYFFTDQGGRRVTREGVCALANRLFVFPKGRGDRKVI